jgi:hypothetical protein
LTSHGLSSQLATRASRFQFHKRGQFFVGMHNETLSVAAMHNELNQPREFNRRSHDAVIRV